MRLSESFKGAFLDVVCMIIGTIMFYRGVVEAFFYNWDPIHLVLGAALLMGAYACYLMYRRQRLGYWLFVLGNLIVAYVFIFILEDIWHHHVWPHIVYAAVFLPFWSDLDGRRDLLRDKPLPTRIANQLLNFVVIRIPWLLRALQRIGPIGRWMNRQIIHQLSARPPGRPLPLSLWTSDRQPLTVDSKHAPSSIPSWPGLVDRAYTGRHLPPVPVAEVEALPPLEEVAALFERDTFVESSRTTTLFCFFAQWFTDSFLRTHPNDRRLNTSNHEIDLCQIYGLGEESTSFLRTGKDGLLKSRNTDVGELPALLAPDGTVAPDLERIAYDPAWATSFADTEPPHGMARDLKKFLKEAIGDWAVEPGRWKVHYAAGLERANSTIVYSAINTIFLREHNRLARELKARNPDWDDARLFETARNINIVQLLKIIVEDYINHLAGLPVKIMLEQGFADSKQWYRTNRIALEFDLLYRWHAMVPDTLKLGGHELINTEFRFDNRLIEAGGVEAIIDTASRQAAGRLTLGNTPDFLMEAERRSIAFGRLFRLAPFNAYRERWQLRPYDTFEELTGGDTELAERLAALYPDRNGARGIDCVELYVGLFAEGRKRSDVLPPLLLVMVASDAFTQALTNPLLAENVFSMDEPSAYGLERVDVFTKYGRSQIDGVSTLADVVARNVAPGKEGPRVRFTLDDA
ncbi:peroxidase family protein [uncultured Jannaschia sp.]|uniref:peroxidase family protein n=1 Tax=uncultured Jannaschia sp. TaxID=293347 RepID=UPI002605AA15|nr:peroxidase family protein [uncultured Jannaschia sp.]